LKLEGGVSVDIKAAGAQALLPSAKQIQQCSLRCSLDWIWFDWSSAHTLRCVFISMVPSKQEQYNAERFDVL